MTARPVWKVIVFSLITLGIYQLYWTYKTRQELVAHGGQIPRFRVLFYPLLGLIAVAVIQAILHATLAQHGANNAAISTMNGSSADASLNNLNNAAGPTKIFNILSLVAGVLVVVSVIPITLVWFYRYSKAVNQTTHGKTSTGLAFGMWILLSFLGFGFVWPGLIQDGFNHVDTPEPAYPA